ncbi:leucine-rich repeat-containing protein 74A [Patella vulgata]|uniref:leucine-rich repeat-containing protein 74A n=1 Tax=Patella vulgata TaxID=6465 RepID=UPI00217FD4F7|nr:leucine-rich repeat-containing protein 74A [Patella vulgata]
MSWRRVIPRRKNGYVPRPRFEQVLDTDSEASFDIDVVHKLFEEPDPIRLSLSATLARMREREELLANQESKVDKIVIPKPYNLSDDDDDNSDDNDDDDDVDNNAPQDEVVLNGVMESEVPNDIDIIEDENSDDEFDLELPEELTERSRRRLYDTREMYIKACRSGQVQPSNTYLHQLNRQRISLRSLLMKPRDIKPVAVSLVRDTVTTVLDLSYNDLGPVGIMYVAEMIQENNSLLDIELSATFPGKHGLLALAEALKANKNICTVNLSHNGIEHTEAHIIADIIESVVSLEELYLSHNKLGYEGGKSIATAVGNSKTLLTLDLEWNNIRRASAVELAKMLANNTTLKTLNVAWNGFGKEGCIAFGKSLVQNTTLYELNLSSNRVDPSSLSYLLRGLMKNTGLVSLKLNGNSITTEGCKALVATIGTSKTSNIKDIALDGVPVDAEFVEMVKILSSEKNMTITHGRQMKIGTVVDPRKHDSSDLSQYDPVLILFEYMRLDNLRLIDLFKMFDFNKRDKLSKNNFREGLTVLQIPLTEHALCVIMKSLDTKKDRFVDLEEFMNGQKETSRYIIQRQLKAKKKKKEDEGLLELRKILKEIIKQRKEMQSEKDKAKHQEIRDKKDKKDKIDSIKAGEKKSVAGVFKEAVLRVMREAQFEKEQQLRLPVPISDPISEMKV